MNQLTRYELAMAWAKKSISRPYKKFFILKAIKALDDALEVLRGTTWHTTH